VIARIRGAEILSGTILKVFVADQWIGDGQILHRRAREGEVRPRREHHACDRCCAMRLLDQLRQRHQRQTAASGVTDNRYPV
jgi:hypothetical protein